MLGDRAVPGRLRDLQRREGGHREADRSRVDLRGPRGDRSSTLEPVESSLHRPARYAEPSGRLQDTDPRLAGEEQDDPAVQSIQVRHIAQSTGQIAAQVAQSAQVSLPLLYDADSLGSLRS